MCICVYTKNKYLINLDENILINRIKEKDGEAFKIFIENYQKYVLNICVKFLRNKPDAEEVAQDVFIEVFFSINSFKGDSKLSTWLYRIAVNKSLDMIKKKKRKKRYAEIISLFGLHLSKEQSIKSNITPLSIIEKKDRKNLILNAIDKLPENQKTAITLSKLEGMSYQEIAEILKTTSSAVDSLIQRAKQNIKKYLSSEDII